MRVRRKSKYTYFISKKIKHFLLSDKSREFLIFLVFFVIASGFWLIQTLNNEYETELSIPVRIENIPNDVAITYESISEIKIKIKDRGTILLNYLLGKSFTPILINFSDYKDRKNYIKIQTTELEKQIVSQLNTSTKLLALYPDTLNYIYATGKPQRVPVRLLGNVTAGYQHYISDTIFHPDSVSVYAPKAIIGSIMSAFTEHIQLENLSDTTSTQVKLYAPKGVKFIPDHVFLKFPVDVYAEKKIDVPLIGINFPAGKILRAFPSNVQVTFQVGASRFRKIGAKDFIIGVPYEELIQLGTGKYHVKLKAMPKGVSLIRIIPEEVDFLIEQTISNDN